MSSSAPHPKSSLLANQHQHQHQHQNPKHPANHRAAPCLPSATCLQQRRGQQQQQQHGQQQNKQQQTQNQQPSPFLRLPSEIRLLIYSYLLPHNQDITFHPLARKHPATGAPVAAHSVQIPGVWASIGIWTSLLRTCRQLHAEGADALYGGNRFHFSLTCRERVWAFTSSPSPPPHRDGDGDGGGGRVRGGWGGGAGAGGDVHALNTPYARGLPVNTLRTSGIGASALCRMRSVTLRIEEDLSRPDSYRRVQTWLREMVDGLNGGEDEGERSVRGRAPAHCLQELRIELVTGVFRYGGFPSFTDSVFWEFLPEKNGDVGAQWQFVLEPLARLKGIREVDVRGHLKPDFAKKLAEIMMVRHQGDEDAMEGIEYGVQTVARKSGTVTRSTRRFYEPELDWQLEEG